MLHGLQWTGMIMGASTSSVWYNLRVPHPTKDVPIIDYDLALLFQPMLMLGITIGVELSVIFPYWLITVLIIILFLGWSPTIAYCLLTFLRSLSFYNLKVLYLFFRLTFLVLEIVTVTCQIHMPAFKTPIFQPL